ncbi:ComEA family DNA-binding protein [Streptomyces sp. CoH27]|uniref:ComEA family DNA-binding protein n=1 Tax=Streptomyces sp. CoH27 TaxID=2875763 RepID=UPI001CD7B678|nr:ComEA family DNA-binding protein [Streptomyces sp. CoH27]
MALRSRTRIASAGSGPGRAPASDGRVRHRCTEHGRTRRRPPDQSEELRRRAELLFGERALRRRESDNGPPDGDRRAAIATAATVTETGPATGLSPETELIQARTAATATTEAEAEPEPTEPARPLEAPDPAGPGRRERAALALRERMPVWLQARCGVERRGVVALAVVLVTAAAFAVLHFWNARTETVRAPQVVRAELPYDKKGADTRSGASAPASAAPGGEIVVDVSGKVRQPGIRRLPAGSRVADALRAAGGVRPGVSTEGLNRARFLVDGEQVVVGAPAGAVAPPGPMNATASGAAGAGSTTPLSLNTATADQLDSLPGVGPVLARHIVDYRTQHGGFRSVDELREVNGIGDRRFSDLRQLVRP